MHGAADLDKGLRIMTVIWFAMLVHRPKREELLALAREEQMKAAMGGGAG